MAPEIAIQISPEPIQSFFNNLESQKTIINTITDLHKTLITHFSTLQAALSQKSQNLDSQIKTLVQNTRNALQEFQNREDAIPDRESVLQAQVEGRKADAIAEIENLRDLKNKGLSEVFRVYCRRMDSDGLVKFMIAKRKEASAFKPEIAAAAEECVDSMRLVLDAVEDFVGVKMEGKPGIVDKRWACALLIQSMVPLSLDGGGVGRNLKERAATVLERWRKVTGADEEGSGGIGSGEASMFLQMVIGFGLKEKFEEKFLKNLVVDFAARKDMPKFAMTLDFGKQLEDIIDELVKSRKEIEAVYFACESGLTKRFPPVSLLRSCLKKCRKNVNSISKSGNHSMASSEKAVDAELEATKAIIKCVEDLKLESQFSIDSLKKRITQLETTKADRRKSTGSKPSNKRPHGGGGKGGSGPSSSSRPPKSRRFSNASPSFLPRYTSQSLQGPVAQFSGPYTYPTQRVYEGPGISSYGSGYAGARAQSPATVPQQYTYAAHDVGVGVPGGGTYGGQGSYGGQDTYGVYDYGMAAAPMYPPTYPQQ
ncbi:FRIGIDA-like protein 4a [Forsythia ovata]|uniref:FRIGIDA-like protein n=1 Tax=Forsythia ovata TaxID=205694 RepID=A0ABD1W2N1_9LAMI